MSVRRKIPVVATGVLLIGLGYVHLAAIYGIHIGDYHGSTNTGPNPVNEIARSLFAIAVMLSGLFALVAGFVTDGENLENKSSPNWLSGAPDWNAENRAKWQKTRGEGKWNFILVHGIIRFGVIFALLLAAMEYHQLEPNGFFAIPLKALAGGILFGFFSWLISEKSYLKHIAHTTISGDQA